MLKLTRCCAKELREENLIENAVREACRCYRFRRYPRYNLVRAENVLWIRCGVAYLQLLKIQKETETSY